MGRVLPFTAEMAKGWRDAYGSPIYVYDQAAIEKTARDVLDAFSWNRGFVQCFAVKALPTPAIIRTLANVGCGTDCASISELAISKASGLEGRKVMFTSNETEVEAYRKAVELGAIVNLDDITQIDNLFRCESLPEMVCLRYNPGSFSFSSSIMGNLSDSKFGMTHGQILEGYRILRERGIKHFGIHSMCASCCLDESYYPSLAEMLFNLVVEVREKLGIGIEMVDLGGGIGIPYREGEQPVDIHRIADGVKEKYRRILTPAGIEVSLYTEMGRYITGPHGYLLATVQGKKAIYRSYIGLDATACDLMRPAMYGAYHQIVVLGKESKEPTGFYDVCGGLCENNDKFAIQRKLPDVELGDMVAICDSGAHGRSMGYNYNGFARCGELLLSADGHVRLIRRSESLDDLFATFDVDGEFGP